MNVLTIGDIVGRPGRSAVKQLLGSLRDELGVDLCVANAENAAGGCGLTPALAEELFAAGADCLTMGDHVFRRRELISYLQTEPRLIRPANFPLETPGKGWTVVQTTQGISAAVINLLGRTFMNPIECPFHAVDAILKQIPADVRVIIVDLHAEATSEKIAMGWYLDGRVSAVVGTHTHVPTADAHILPEGTAYITDIGMTGPYESVLGRRIDRVLRTIVTRVPTAFDVAKGDVRLAGALLRIDERVGKATAIERIERRVELVEQQPPPTGGSGSQGASS